jgi:hypothetical protein
MRYILAPIARDERRALETIIAAEPTGCPEHLLIAGGFTVEFVASLVRSGLASVVAERTGAMFRLWATERGRQAMRGL